MFYFHFFFSHCAQKAFHAVTLNTDTNIKYILYDVSCGRVSRNVAILKRPRSCPMVRTRNCSSSECVLKFYYTLAPLPAARMATTAVIRYLARGSMMLLHCLLCS